MIYPVYGSQREVSSLTVGNKWFIRVDLKCTFSSIILASKHMAWD